MAAPFIIPESAFKGFEALIEIGDQRLAKLGDHVRSKRLALNSSRLITELSEAIGAPEDALNRAIGSVLIPLSTLRSDFDLSGDDFVEMLTHLIEAQDSEWYKRNLPGWTSISSSLAPLIESNSYFALMSKAYRLLSNRPALVDTFRILTEMRSVYDDEVTRIKAYLITSTLAVSYQKFGDMKRIHFTLDKVDLERLRDQLERALQKIKLLEQQVTMLEVPPLVPGGE